MKIQVYSLFDNVSGVHNAPFTAANDGIATRSLLDVLRKDDSLRANAADYVLFWIGTFDSESGSVEPQERPVRVIGIGELVRQVGVE